MENTQNILEKAFHLMRDGKKQEAKQLLDDTFVNTPETKNFKAKLQEHDDDMAICSKELFCQMFNLTNFTFDILLDIADEFIIKLSDDMVAYGRKAIDFITNEDEYDFRRQYMARTGLIPNCVSRKELKCCYNLSDTTISVLALSKSIEHVSDDINDDDAMFKLTPQFKNAFSRDCENCEECKIESEEETF